MVAARSDDTTERLTFRGVDGLELAGDRRGDPTAPPVLLLHGGGQTRYSWGGTASVLADAGWRAYTVDLRGHGESEWSETADYRLPTMARDIGMVVDEIGSPPFLIGASLGGLAALMLTGEVEPGVARGVVLVDVVPDMERAGAQRIQAFMAERALTGFDSLEEVADAVAAYNPHRPRPADLSGLRKNVRERDGRFYWHWDPVFMGGVADMPPDEVLDADRLHRAVARTLEDVPLLLVRGRQSDLVSVEKAEEFAERFPAAEYVDVEGAGHMVAGDRNDAFTGSVLDFLARHR
jgi:pimeloyl-ACP methyl ester carboxylesterase